jgi:hypothetical protein
LGAVRSASPAISAARVPHYARHERRVKWWAASNGGEIARVILSAYFWQVNLVFLPALIQLLLYPLLPFSDSRIWITLVLFMVF